MCVLGSYSTSRARLTLTACRSRCTSFSRSVRPYRSAYVHPRAHGHLSRRKRRPEQLTSSIEPSSRIPSPQSAPKTPFAQPIIGKLPSQVPSPKSKDPRYLDVLFPANGATRAEWRAGDDVRRWQWLPSWRYDGPDKRLGGSQSGFGMYLFVRRV